MGGKCGQAELNGDGYRVVARYGGEIEILDGKV